MSATNCAENRREADSELYRRYGIKRYEVAKRCPNCGAKSYRRKVTGECFECVVRERR